MAINEALLKQRDEKVIPHLNQYAPVWIIAETYVPANDSIVFNVAFQHNRYGWVNRRYRYDGFNNVLYHKGQTSLSESEALDIQEKEPYITAIIADIPNAYGG